MNALSRRKILFTTVAGAAAFSGCSNVINGNGDEEETVTLAEQQFTGANTNPLVIQFSTEETGVLDISADTTEPVVGNLVDGDDGTPVATLGEGVGYSDQNAIQGIPIPESPSSFVLCVGSNSDAQFDIEVKASEVTESETGTLSEQSLTEQVEMVASEITDIESDRSREIVGPLWVQVVAEQAQIVTPTVDAEAMESIQDSVFSGLAMLEVEQWVDQRVDQIAGVLTAAAVSGVSAKTGIPAGLIEGTLEDNIEEALTGDRVEWVLQDSIARQLNPSGGNLQISNDLVLDLSIEGIGVEIITPMTFEVATYADSIPATASVNDFDILTDQTTIR